MLDGRGGAADDDPPRKSNPSNESPALFCLGGAVSAFGGALAATGGPVLGRWGVGSSPKRSMAGWGCTCRCGGGGWLELCARRCEAERSICTFSWTFFNGMSSSSASRVEGSGMGPSMTQRFDSYFVRMKFSIFASEGTWPGASFDSQYLFARALPHFRTLCSCSSVQVSKSTDLTLLICVPMPRCIPEHRMHMKTPRFQLAHRGCLFLLQSEHVLLPSSLTRFFSVARFCSARSAAGLGRRDIVG